MVPLSLGIYVDDFVYFSADPAAEDLFCRLLAECCNVDFMGIVEWFLGIHFSWRITPSSVVVHMNQSGFATNLVESFFRQSRDVTPTATPYRSGVPIDSIAPSLDPNNSPAQLVGKRPIKVWSVASVGCHVVRGSISLRFIPSFLPTQTNRRPVI
jgi:hypothetical protein